MERVSTGPPGILAEEDFVGQYTQTSSGSISGGVDFTELSANSVVTGAALSGTMTVVGDGTLRNTYTHYAGYVSVEHPQLRRLPGGR